MDTVGPVEYISIEESGMDYLARIDTGARTTSVHAVDLSVRNESKEMKDNIGKTVTFTTINEEGEKHKAKATITGVQKVRNSQGVEYRYIVEMTLNWKGQTKAIEVNLRDRSKMTYKLLIGRNWLIDDYIVDVALPEKPTKY